jgi:NAD(P)-dependent dehydrogenase (short-subunit alcohol dehydrogenase family)
MRLGLDGKRVVVTGASKGIGLAVTRSPASEGVHVVAGARHASAELAALAGVHPVQVDLESTCW